MFGFLTPVRSDSTDPLTDVATVEAFWRKVPRGDPFVARKAVCRALAEPVARSSLDIDRLHALLVLDNHARGLVETLLSVDAAPDAEAPWQSAFELSWSFGRAYGQFLRSISDGRGSEGWRQYESQMLLRLFHHRHLELLLRPFVDERSTRFAWKEVHAAYRFAQSRGLLHDEVPINRTGSPLAAETTLEREYIIVLMQDCVNGGNFPPHDALWIGRRIGDWCRAMRLTPQESAGGDHRFVVDPLGEAGIASANGNCPDTCFSLDISGFVNSMRDEIATLRDAPNLRSDGPVPGRARKLAALFRLNTLCAPERPVIARRGERVPTAVSVEVVVGMSRIVRTLRGLNDVVAAAPRIAQKGDGVTITEFGGATEGSTLSCGASTVTRSPATLAGLAPALLTMADRSESGCRLHGPALGSPMLPGALIAFREDAASPWTLAVVRRVRKRLAGKRIEIGAEYLGKNPRLVVVVLDSDASVDKNPHVKAPRFGALYLSESVEHPVLPMKTLVLPALGLLPGARLSVRSRTMFHTIQLKEPLEEQADFIWSPFEILERRLKDDPATSDAAAI